MRSFPVLLALALVVTAVTWNGLRFRTDERTIRTKDLSFLPAPEVAKALAFGHDNSASRLRWIDTFAYFQLQLDRKDDTVAGGGRGFERLYDTLIALDPHFEPYYHHAALAVGGLLGRHDRELGYLLRGTQELPHCTQLWRHAASVLYLSFHWDERHPGPMDHFLAAWAASELDEQQRRQVWDWKAAMARRRFRGLEQLPYWLDRLADTAAKTPMGDYIEDVIYEQLVGYALRELNTVLADRRSAGLPAESVADLLDPARLNARHLDATWGPVTSDANGNPVLRCDPYGYAYEVQAGEVVSPGRQYWQFERAVRAANAGNLARDYADLAALRAAGVSLPEPPLAASLRLEEGRLIAVVPDPVGEPLHLR